MVFFYSMLFLCISILPLFIYLFQVRSYCICLFNLLFIVFIIFRYSSFLLAHFSLFSHRFLYLFSAYVIEIFNDVLWVILNVFVLQYLLLHIIIILLISFLIIVIVNFIYYATTLKLPKVHHCHHPGHLNHQVDLCLSFYYFSLINI